MNDLIKELENLKGPKGVQTLSVCIEKQNRIEIISHGPMAITLFPVVHIDT